MFRDHSLHLFLGSVEPAVMETAVAYFVVTACSFPLLGSYDSASAQLRVMDQANITMYVSPAHEDHQLSRMLNLRHGEITSNSGSVSDRLAAKNSGKGKPCNSLSRMLN